MDATKLHIPEDIHVYSIDEYFIDITPYTNLYKKTPRQLAQLLLDAVLDATIFTLLLALGLTYSSLKLPSIYWPSMRRILSGILMKTFFKEQIWHHQPITDIWQVGRYRQTVA